MVRAADGSTLAKSSGHRGERCKTRRWSSLLPGLGCPLHVRHPQELLAALERLAQTITSTIAESGGHLS